LITRDVREFGAPVFGFDALSGLRLLEWIKPRYAVVANTGGSPLNPNEVGILLLKNTQP
jgi:hypothetical protein